MNPFRSRKKSIAESDAGKSRVSLDTVPAMPAVPAANTTPATRGRTFRRKKTQPEPKPEINLQDVLPSTDEFRTSLLMPNLSARFSMLREQDDPNSKLGKANDDSVLPRRQSKLNLFSPDGLSDIAEVSSLAGSIRPPFAMDRTHSYSSAGNDDGYGTDDGGSTHGSIMTRAKPGQGNKFFGGRQKIYKVPLGGAVSKGDLNSEEKPMGKAMYNDDISMSAFQKMREDRKQQGRVSLDEIGRDSRENDRSGSLPLAGYNRNRETSSSTNSGPPDARTSTAATSIASQPGATWYSSDSSGFGTKPSPVTTPGVERPHKGKRLYGQGLDQQMMDQQSSALNRLNSIQRNGFNGVGLSRSTSNLNERFNRSGFFSPISNPRSGSPSPAASNGLGGFDFGTNGENKSRSGSKDREAMAQNTPPMSPHTDPTLAAALDANDLGKATASGAFNKPKTQYNEQQFAQRQLQLQEGRETPPPRAFSRQDSHPNEYNGRLRNGSMASVQSANSSRNQFRTGQSSRAPSSASNHKARASPVDPNPATNGTYLADNSGSEYGSSPNSPEPELPTLKPTTYQKPPSTDNVARSTIYEHDDQHPAFRNQPDRLYIEPSDDEDERSSSPRTSNERQPPLDHARKQSMDSPTLGDVSSGDHLGGGLSDLVKGHLRQHSNASSVYPNDPMMDQENSEDGPWGKPPTSAGNARPSFDNPASPNSALGNRARQVLEQANQLANANAKAHDVLGGVGADKVQQVLGGEAPRRSNESGGTAWQEHLKGHNRGASTETQKEREDFASELADRRKQVQEKLKNFADDNSRPQIASSENSPAKSGPFGLLKKSSRSSLVKGNEESKAAKMLGLSGNTMPSGPSPTYPHHPDAFGNGSQSRDPSRGPRPRGPDGKIGAGDGPSFRDRSIGAERREKFFRKTNPSPHATIDRFNAPEATPPPPPAPFGFQRSRTDPANQPISYHPAGRSRKYSPPRPTTVAPTVEVPASEPNSRANSAMGHRSGPGRSPAGSYFPPHPTASPGGRNSPNPQNMGLPPTMNNPRPSPVAPGFSAHTTPPLEIPPHVQQQQAQQAPQMMSQNPVSNPNRNTARKRSINKQDISEPTFVSGTSSVITIDLPAGASLLNGMHDPASAPPVPPINPRRRRAQPTQNLFTAFGNRSPMLPGGGTQSTPNSAHPNGSGSGAGTPAAESPYEERSTFSGDEEDKERKPRRLRKTSSEGGSLAAKARHQALLKEAGVMPGSPGGPRR